MNHLSEIEREIITDGNVKAIRELQSETLKDHSPIVMKAIREHLEDRYNLHDQLQQS